MLESAPYLSSADLFLCFVCTSVIFWYFDKLFHIFVKWVKTCIKITISFCATCFIFFLYKLKNVDFRQILFQLEYAVRAFYESRAGSSFGTRGDGEL